MTAPGLPTASKRATAMQRAAGSEHDAVDDAPHRGEWVLALAIAGGIPRHLAYARTARVVGPLWSELREPLAHRAELDPDEAAGWLASAVPADRAQALRELAQVAGRSTMVELYDLVGAVPTGRTRRPARGRVRLRRALSRLRRRSA